MTAKAQTFPMARTQDPDTLQAQASDPGQSVWVAASAGSGKTKVLTDRVLRLLLPRADGRAGTPPEKILCLTFTRAGAAEMAERINKALAAWAVEDEDILHKKLFRLLGHPAKAEEADAARRLFARVTDSQGGLKILTLHSFCQSVLGRFPLEAGISPHFTLIEEQSAVEIQKTILAQIIRTAETAGLEESLRRLSLEKGEKDLLKLLQKLTQEQQLARPFLEAPEAAWPGLCVRLGVDPGATPETLLATALADTALEREALIAAATVMATDKGARMQERSAAILTMLHAPLEDRPALYKTYSKAFLTNDGTVYAALLSRGLAAAHPGTAVVLEQEAERIQRLQDRLKTLRCARLSHDLLRVGAAFMEHYAAEKARRAVLDYDDLIARTLDLLTGRSMGMDARAATPWVMFKLDQGIDHILVDEAQDTNPDQWAIIHALADDFFTGDGARAGEERTIFAVGDEKQSIFGFQRAAPQKFREAEAFYAAQLREAGLAFESVPMNISFRSGEAVLALTDAVFDMLEPWKALGLPDGITVQHRSYRPGQAGLVELWPLVEAATAAEIEPWTPPVTVQEQESPEALLARRIARKIKSWLGAETLEPYARPVQAGDIMILVKSRGTFVEHMVRALKTAGIAVSGVDRMKLAEQIAVQDLLAAARFALLPEDDLSLAALLRSPFAGITEDGLYACAAGREGALWAEARQQLPPETLAWLSRLIEQGGALRPFEFFCRLLVLPCPGGESGLKAMTGRLGADSLDPLEEFLNMALAFERDNTPTLQHFIAWQAAGNTEIKREMESEKGAQGDSPGGKVRIMTVHAAKGLQAPIVILPDTMHTQGSIEKTGTGERVFWTKAGPLWSPRAEDDCRAFEALLLEHKIKLAEEYRRLLYVALTRAADRLYIAGCSKGPRSKPAPDCWYNLVKAGFLRCAARCESFTAEQGDKEATIRLACTQTAEPDRAEETQATPARRPACADWAWLDRAPPEEETPPRPFAPSRPAEPEPAAPSPLDGTGEKKAGYRFRRGLVTHSLLQFLPALPQAGWQEAAQHFVRRQEDLGKTVQDDIVREVMAILYNPAFAPVFGPGSMAEVPVSARIGTQLISGQIDRLLVTEKEILIVDYKTNRPPPAQQQDVPALYRSQLRAYRDAVGKIYPGREIRTFLLWTDGPHMMEIPV